MKTKLDYLLEFRTRLIRCLIVTVLFCCLLLPFSNTLYHVLAIPLLKQLPHSSSLIAIALPAAFFVPMKFTFIVAIIAAIPFTFYQFWCFIAPALYQHERYWFWVLLPLSTALFYLGILFAYFVVFPLVFHFFIQTAPAGVAVLPDISQYLDFVSQLFLAFGVAFEIPIIIVALVALDITTAEKIANLRRYFIVLAFVFAMLITPPDVVSQSMLAIPMCLLFEIGLLLVKVIKPLLNSTPDHAKTTF